MEQAKTGTSTVGITFKGGVVVGADHRALWVILLQQECSEIVQDCG